MEIGIGGGTRSCGPDSEGQVNSKTFDRGLAVLVLAAFFAGLPGDTRWPVRDHNRGFNFVAMLPSRSASAGPLDGAILEKVRDRECGGVWRTIQNGSPVSGVSAE